MTERKCSDKAIESELFEGQDKFLANLSIIIDGKKVKLLGIINIPASLKHFIDIPLDNNGKDLIGVEKTILRVNRESMAKHHVDKLNLLEAFEAELSAVDRFDIYNDPGRISIVRTIDEEGLYSPAACGLQCPVMYIRRACDLMGSINNSANSLRVSFKNVSS